jgi:hypothetical protein
MHIPTSIRLTTLTHLLNITATCADTLPSLTRLERLPLGARRLALPTLRLLNLQPRLRLLVLLAEHVALDEQADQQTERAEDGVHDPHVAQRVGKGGARDDLLGSRELGDDAYAGAGCAAGERGGCLGAEGGAQRILLGGHAVLEDDRAYDDGDGGAEVADETEGGGRRGNVGFLECVR